MSETMSGSGGGSFTTGYVNIDLCAICHYRFTHNDIIDIVHMYPIRRSGRGAVHKECGEKHQLPVMGSIWLKAKQGDE